MFLNILTSFLKFIASLILRIAGLISFAFLLVYFFLPLGIKLYAYQKFSLNIGEVSLARDNLVLKDLTDQTGDISITSVGAYFIPTQLLSGEIERLEISDAKIAVKFDPSQQDSRFKPKQFIDLLENPPLYINDLKFKNIFVKFNDFTFQEMTLAPVKMTIAVQGSLAKEAKPVFKISADVLSSANLRGGQVLAEVNWPEIKGDIKLQKIKYQQLPLILDLSFNADYTGGAGLKFSGVLDEESIKSLISFKGEIDSFSSGHFSFTMKEKKIDSSSYPIQSYWATSPKELQSYSFMLSGQGDIQWQEGKVISKGQVSLKDGSFIYDTIVATGLQAELKLEHLLPNIALKDQRVNIKELIVPLTKMTNVKVLFTYQLGQFLLEKVDGKIWDGDFTISHAVLEPRPKDQLLKLNLQRISLKKLIEELEIPDLKAEGMLEGSLPIRLHDDTSIAIEQGELTTTGKGFLSYHWPMAIQSEDSNLRLTGKALDNFVYEQMTLMINKPRLKDISLVLDLKGKNPKLLEGRPFEIKFSITGDVLKALDATIKTFQGDIKHFRQQ